MSRSILSVVIAFGFFARRTSVGAHLFCRLAEVTLPTKLKKIVFIYVLFFWENILNFTSFNKEILPSGISWPGDSLGQMSLFSHLVGRRWLFPHLLTGLLHSDSETYSPAFVSSLEMSPLLLTVSSTGDLHMSAA